MLSYRVSYNNCSDCFQPCNLTIKVDEAITAMGKRMYESRIYLIKRNISRRKLRTLLYYKEILDNLLYNQMYYTPRYTYQEIDSRIKVLINGLR